MAKLKFSDADKVRANLTKQQVKDIQSMYAGIAKQMKSEIANLSKDESVSATLKQQYLKGLLKQTTEQLNDTKQLLESTITSNMQDTASAVTANTVKHLNSMGFALTGEYSHIPKETVLRVASGQLYDTEWSLSKAIWGATKKADSDINSIVAQGIAANKSSYDIAKDLEMYVDPTAKKPWDWGKVYPNTSKRIDYNAQRLARTMVSHAYQDSFVRTTKDNPFFTGYQWLISHSRTCELCISRAEQNDYGLGVGVFPKGNLPLDHPNGMCTFAVTTVDSLENISQSIADWYKAPTGSYPEIDKYAAIFKGGN